MRTRILFFVFLISVFSFNLCAEPNLTLTSSFNINSNSEFNDKDELNQVRFLNYLGYDFYNFLNAGIILGSSNVKIKTDLRTIDWNWNFTYGIFLKSNKLKTIRDFVFDYDFNLFLSDYPKMNDNYTSVYRFKQNWNFNFKTKYNKFKQTKPFIILNVSKNSFDNPYSANKNSKEFCLKFGSEYILNDAINFELSIGTDKSISLAGNYNFDLKEKSADKTTVKIENTEKNISVSTNENFVKNESVKNVTDKSDLLIKAENENLKNAMTAVTTEKKELINKIETLEKTISTGLTEKNQLINKIGDLEKSNTDFKNSADAALSEKNDLVNQKSELLNQKNELINQTNNLKLEVTAFNNEKSEFLTKIQNLENINAEASRSIENLKKLNSELNHTISVSSAEQQKLISDFDKTIKENETLKTMYKDNTQNILNELFFVFNNSFSSFQYETDKEYKNKFDKILAEIENLNGLLNTENNFYNISILYYKTGNLKKALENVNKITNDISEDYIKLKQMIFSKMN